MLMQFHQLTLDNCSTAAGTVVVIDVCRAFTTAAYAFAAGAEQILLTGTVEDALALKAAYPGSLVMGEVSGLPVPGFDLWNSPAELAGMDLSGRTLIQRTTSGTQGMLLSTSAEHLIATSFVVARATARWIKALQPDAVYFVVTGVRPAGGGEEDIACAQYIADLLKDREDDPQRYMGWVNHSFADLLKRAPALEERMQADLFCCQQANLFNFAMIAERMGTRLVLKPAGRDGVS